MNIRLRMLFVAFALFVPGVLTAEDSKKEDPYLWLEDLTSQKATDWVELENARTGARLKTKPDFKVVTDEALKILESKDNLPRVELNGDHVDDIWQDHDNPSGVWRRTSLESFRIGKPRWEAILDIDKLNNTEKTNYSLNGYDCLKPFYVKCIVYLANAGSDATEIREYDALTKTFVKDGFRVPSSRSVIVWIDADTVYVGDGTEEALRTISGNARVVKKWKRGESLASAPVVFEVAKKDLKAGVSTIDDAAKEHFIFYRVAPDIEVDLKYLKDGQLIDFVLPKFTNILGISNGLVFFQNKKMIESFTEGSVLATPLDALLNGKLQMTSVVTPTPQRVLADVRVTERGLYLNVTKDVQSVLELVVYQSGKWVASEIRAPRDGAIALANPSKDGSILLFSYENMIKPTVLYAYSDRTKSLSIIQSLPARFNSEDLELTQTFVKSSDGTKIPYFLARKKSAKFDGKNPTILFGYGGFQLSMLPVYMKLSGKLWLERGGVFAFANLRGGGEYGPHWHEMGKRERKQNVFDDFTAVAKDLIARKITSPEHLGTRGGSNGGLLVAAAFTQHPELFKAVVCESPVLDMMRFHKLMAGPNWIDEYGNPDDSNDAAFLKKYSPYENVKPKAKAHFPEVLLMTSKNDDRVHPAHARKMAAKLNSKGQDVLFYEAEGGGHFNNSLRQAAEAYALSIVFLADKLGMEPLQKLSP